ncbi:MAG: type II toxin-antitoxin system prevent-host-death family antitoxin [Mariprofundaceae bacterium]|nr:type II toxin-antitoxin system prevent-host-death family antitoxin [Mariprofundaceae bacterium]
MQVPINEFKSHLSKYVRQAQSGEIVELTSHRKVVARMTGVLKTNQQGLAKLLESGAASWQGGKPVGASLNLKAVGAPVSALVMEDRG